MSTPIFAKDLYKIITKEDVEKAILYLSTGKHNLINSIKYDVLLSNGKTLPPKELMRCTAEIMGYSLREDGFAGGQVNTPLKKLGFKIVDKGGNPI